MIFDKLIQPYCEDKVMLLEDVLASVYLKLMFVGCFEWFKNEQQHCASEFLVVNIAFLIWKLRTSRIQSLIFNNCTSTNEDLIGNRCQHCVSDFIICSLPSWFCVGLILVWLNNYFEIFTFINLYIWHLICLTFKMFFQVNT